MTSPLIQLDDVSKKYDVGRPALAGMNPEVNAGEAPAVLGLLDDLTIEDDVPLSAQLAGMPGGQARSRAKELLNPLGVQRHAGSLPGTLSGGERQPVAIPRALMNRPALILADEPTGALDSASAADVRDLLITLNRDGQPIPLVPHDTALAEACATRTIALLDGAIVRHVRLALR